MEILKEVAVATAVVNYDLVQNDLNAMRPYARTLVGMVLMGSAAAGDTEVEIMVGGTSKARVRNTGTGVAYAIDHDLQKCDIFVPANALVQAYVRDAPATNPVLIGLDFGRPASTRSARRPYAGRRRTTGVRRATRRTAGGFM